LEITARILEKNERPDWDNFVASHSLGNIHQTSRWGEFQAARGSGWGYWIIGVFAGEKLAGGALVLRRRLPAGRSWLYIPKGPLLQSSYGQENKNRPDKKKTGEGKIAADEQLKALLKAIRELAKAEKALFLRVEPAGVLQGPPDFGERGEPNWQNFGFKPAHAHYQPEHSLVVDLRPGQEQILAQMKPKGRYNIKVAQKKGVEVLVAGEAGGPTLQEGAAEFHRLLKETTSRDGFSAHSAEYYLQMLQKLGADRKDGLARLNLARLEGKIIAAIIVTFYRDLAIYYFGASANSHRNVMAPYLLQWKAMQESKKRGMKWYDFLGTAPLMESENGFEYDQKHAWAGVTEFKLKFGGQKVDFEKGRELILNPLQYRLLQLLKAFSWLRRLFRRR